MRGGKREDVAGAFGVKRRSGVTVKVEVVAESEGDGDGRGGRGDVTVVVVEAMVTVEVVGLVEAMVEVVEVDLNVLLAS